MTYYQFAGLGIFLIGFLNLYALVTRIDRWRALLGPAAKVRAARLAIVVYACGFIVVPMTLGLSLIYIIGW